MADRPIESFRPNQALFWEGTPAERVYRIDSGVVRLYGLMTDGRRVIMRFAFPGDFLGMSSGDAHGFGAEAVDKVKVRRIGRTCLLAAAEREPGLSSEMLTVALEELSAARAHLLLLAGKTAEERVASFILQIARRVSADGTIATEIPLSMTRCDIADHLGLALETVSRLVSKLKSDGLIALPSPHRAVLLDPAGLSVAAGDGSAKLRTPRATNRCRGRAA